MNARVLIAATLLAGCASQRTEAPVSAPDHAGDALPFIEDDYGRAVALAKERSVPLFVDVWAPW